MALLYRNITGSTGVNVQLLSANSAGSNVRSISISNTNSSAGTVSIFLQDNKTTGSSIDNTFYLIKNISIPVGVTLLLDDANMLRYDVSKYSLNATVGSSDTFTIKIS
jgi:outer membrane protein W